MNKENGAYFLLGIFIFSYVLDILNGPLTLPIRNPLMFLSSEILSVYPFTAVSVVLKVIFLFAVISLVASLIKKKYFSKAITLFIVAGLCELYAVQQFATGLFMLPVTWTLAIAFTAILLLLLTIWYVVVGILSSLHVRFSSEKDDKWGSTPFHKWDK